MFDSVSVSTRRACPETPGLGRDYLTPHQGLIDTRGALRARHASGGHLGRHAAGDPVARHDQERYYEGRGAGRLLTVTSHARTKTPGPKNVIGDTVYVTSTVVEQWTVLIGMGDSAPIRSAEGPRDNR